MLGESIHHLMNKVILHQRRECLLHESMLAQGALLLFLSSGNFLQNVLVFYIQSRPWKSFLWTVLFIYFRNLHFSHISLSSFARAIFSFFFLVDHHHQLILLCIHRNHKYPIIYGQRVIFLYNKVFHLHGML